MHILHTSLFLPLLILIATAHAAPCALNVPSHALTPGRLHDKLTKFRLIVSWQKTQAVNMFQRFATDSTSGFSPADYICWAAMQEGFHPSGGLDMPAVVCCLDKSIHGLYARRRGSKLRNQASPPRKNSGR
ncbi:hypothetical protein C8F04DRAFT_1179472 [Mycena alexandri]|uniref:Uncharacterized protein n=1 Tax=Mycena alexandri TaxID=1745969 RepID=A0AAD6T5G3_9AGAR|nr:hypothetical protein C8F04DRAFT_1179472 [Mycena alexandri]